MERTEVFATTDDSNMVVMKIMSIIQDLRDLGDLQAEGLVLAFTVAQVCLVKKGIKEDRE